MDPFVYGIIFSIITLIIILLIQKRRKRFSIFSDNGIPGPKPSFWTGNMKEVLEMRENFDYENAKKYGNIFGYFIGAKPILSVADPDLMKLIQVKEFKIFYNRDGYLPDFGIPSTVGKNIIPFNRDEDWKRIRSIVYPTVSAGKIKKMFQIIINTTDIFMEQVSRKSTNKEQFDIYLFYKGLIMDITTRSAFGIETGVQCGSQDLFLESIGRVLKTDISDLLATISVCFPEIEPIPTKLRELIDISRSMLGLPSVKTLIQSLQEVIERRKSSLQKRNDVLQYLIDGKVEMKKLSSIKDEDLMAKETLKEERELKTNGEDADVIKLTNNEIITSSITFLAAGNETTSVTLSYASYFLAANPDMQEKVREEIRLTIGNKENIEYDDLLKLQYLDQVIAEALRLFPLTSFAINRISKKQFQYKEITIPKDITVTLPLWALHRNPDYWPDPDKFIPERFSPENKTNINVYNYQPFGNGPRNCLGMRFAQITMKFTLARLLNSYRLVDCNEEGLSHYFSIFMVHPNKVMVKAIPLTA